MVREFKKKRGSRGTHTEQPRMGAGETGCGVFARSRGEKRHARDAGRTSKQGGENGRARRDGDSAETVSVTSGTSHHAGERTPRGAVQYDSRGRVYRNGWFLWWAMREW